MSRLAVALLLSLPLAAVPARAQNPESEADRRVQGWIERQEEQAGVNQRRCRIGSGQEDAITVCAPLDPEAHRLPIRGRGAASRGAAGDDGQTPDVAGGGIFKGPATVANVCLLPPCPRDAVYYIDLDSLPPTPPGSDADLVGRGEMKDR